MRSARPGRRPDKPLGEAWLEARPLRMRGGGHYLARVMVESGLGAEAVKPFDAVREPGEERDKR
jgi:hypothetical protein